MNSDLWNGSIARMVIDDAFDAGAERMAILFSGGHDSFTASHIASRHSKFDGNIYHIDTGIGAAATRGFVEDVCREQNWTLNILKSPSTYEQSVIANGFPGPGSHMFVYARLKERCVRMIMRRFKPMKVALITGARTQESTRRMLVSKVVPIRVGDPSKRGVVNKTRIWVSPCHDWSSERQVAYMDHFDLPRNPIKMTPIGMSGECFCGSFARPNEIAMIERYAPDVHAEIVRLAEIAKAHGKPCIWGTRPDRKRGIVTASTGPLCNSCDARQMAAGITVEQE